MEPQSAGGRFEDHVVEQVSAANDIVEIISQYVPPEACREASQGLLSVSSGKIPFIHGPTREADVPLFWLRGWRGCLQLSHAP